jgi:hypothetical protein
MALTKGKVYTGIIHKKPAIYLGLWSYEGSEVKLHQFEYVHSHYNVAGYGQTDEQMNRENYTVAETEDMLYGREDEYY